MVSYSSWNGLKLSATKRLLSEVLKQELGFEVLTSDYRMIIQILLTLRTRLDPINAGMDMAMGD